MILETRAPPGPLMMTGGIGVIYGEYHVSVTLIPHNAKSSQCSVINDPMGRC